MREADRDHLECAAQQLWIPGFYAGDSYRVSQSAERDLVWLDDWSEKSAYYFHCRHQCHHQYEVIVLGKEKACKAS